MFMTIKEKYIQKAVPALKEAFGLENIWAVPKIVKVSINSGVGARFKDAKFLDTIEGVITRISGQKPVRRRAKKSISNFKIREGNIVGMSVTLRGPRMFEFLNKLINITLPRVRDFQGLSDKSIDKSGNLSIGFKEYLAFPEIGNDEVEMMHGMQVSITTTAKSYDQGLVLFKQLGFPFKTN